MQRELPAGRLYFIDALRGVAALGVLCHHLKHNTVLEPLLNKILPAFVVNFCGFGKYGVEIFFVLSGFVITHSLREHRSTSSEIIRFIFRRQVRLDPVYWTTIFGVLLLWIAEAQIPNLETNALPSASAVFANIFYLQNIVGSRQIVGVAWTLCIEIQFYLFYMVVLLLANSQSTSFAFHRVLAAILFFTGTLSLASSVLGWNSQLHSTLVPYWCFFAVGSLSYLFYARHVSAWTCGGFFMLMLIATLQVKSLELFFGTVTSGLIVLVGNAGALSRWTGGNALQYFGKISYSLYLVHLPVLSVVMRGGYKITGDSSWAAIGWMLFAAFLCIVVAHLMYTCVERPSMKLAGYISKESIAKRKLLNAT